MDLIEKALRIAQNKAIPPADGKVLDEDDNLVGTQCPGCNSRLNAGEMVVKAKNDLIVHWRCVNA